MLHDFPLIRYYNLVAQWKNIYEEQLFFTIRNIFAFQQSLTRDF